MATYQLISSVTVGAGGASSIDFTSIPSTYTDLVLKLSIRSNATSGNWDFVYLSFNGSTSNFTQLDLYGTGSVAATEKYTSGTNSTIVAYVSNANTTANTFGNIEVYIPNYTSTSLPKSTSADGASENNATSSVTTLATSLWNPGTQAAISSLSVFPASTKSYVQYSTAYLYGVKSS